MNAETPIVFGCGGESLVGVLHRPTLASGFGVVVVVGGPQYRVGSHRQFILLARRLCEHGIAVLRFDCRGMGDSGGDFPGFEQISPDIAAAVDALGAHVPGLRGIVLWGLCDAASAALMYAVADRRIAGMILLNPWVRSEATLARTNLRHYYLARLVSREFWSKLLSGRLLPGRVIGDLAGNLAAGSSRAAAGNQPDFVTRMRNGLRDFSGPVLIVLSGNDFIAAEFASATANREWRAVLDRPDVIRCPIMDANHTFASEAWRNEVAARTLELLRSLDTGGARNT